MFCFFFLHLDIYQEVFVNIKIVLCTTFSLTNSAFAIIWSCRNKKILAIFNQAFFVLINECLNFF